jgi:dienelactone hydrolase
VTRPRRITVILLLVVAVIAAALRAAADREGRPESFHARKGRLREARAMPKAAEAVSTVTELTLTSTSGLEARALVRTPRRTGPPLPAAVVVGGTKRGRRIVTAPGLDAIAAGAVVVGLDYPLPSRRRSWEGLEAVTTLARLRPAAFDTIADVLLALDYLESRPDVDRQRLFLVGGSLGAPVVTIAGAVDPRPAAVVALYGGGSVGALVAHTLQHPSQHARWSAWPAWLAGHALAALLTPLEPTRYAGAIAPRPFLMVNGAGDSLVPRANVQALYDAAREPKELLWVEGEHIQPTETELLAQLSGIVTSWLTARGLLAPNLRLPHHHAFDG